MIVYDESDYVRFEGGFCGQYFAFAANKSDESTFGLVDIDEAACLNEYTSRDNFCCLQTGGEYIFLTVTCW